MRMDLDIWFVTVCADGMNPGGCGGQDAGGPSEETKRKGEKKKKKGKDFVQGSGGQGAQEDTKVVGPTRERSP